MRRLRQVLRLSQHHRHEGTRSHRLVLSVLLLLEVMLAELEAREVLVFYGGARAEVSIAGRRHHPFQAEFDPTAALQ